MQKRTRIEIVLAAALLAGCSGLPWTESAPQEEPAPTVVWIQNPRAYAEDVAGSSPAQRERLREQALAEFLRAPGAAAQVRLNLVFHAATQDLAEAYAAADSLQHALGRTVPTAEAVAVLTGLLLDVERRIDDLRAVASRDSELAALRDAYRVLEAGKTASDAQHAGTVRALREAEAKLEALKSIEQTLEGGAPQANGAREGEGAQ